MVPPIMENQTEKNVENEMGNGKYYLGYILLNTSITPIILP